MDPSGFNLNRISNAIKARDDWKRGKLREPRSIVASIIVLAILLVGLFVMFHQPRRSTNWSILKGTPTAQAQAVERAAKQLPYGIVVPTKLPFHVATVHALVTGGSTQTITITFRNGANTLTESVTNDLTHSGGVRDIRSIQLPHADAAYTATAKGVVGLYWTTNGLLYSLSGMQAGKVLNAGALVSIYRSMN